MRTTLTINDALLQDLRRKAVAERKPFRRVVEETLQNGLANTKIDTVPSLEIPVFDLGLKAAYRSMSLNQLYDQLEAEEVRKVAER